MYDGYRNEINITESNNCVIILSIRSCEPSVFEAFQYLYLKLPNDNYNGDIFDAFM